MKTLFILLLLFSSLARATTLTKARSLPEGSSLQKFTFTKSGITFDKQSNLFDSAEDFRIGIFKTEAKAVELQRQLEKIRLDIGTADRIMRSKNSSFNDLSGPVQHDDFFLVDDYIVTAESNQYKELEVIFKGLQKLEWKQVEGYQLSRDYQKVTPVASGKAGTPEPYHFEFSCSKPAPPAICGYKKHGILYLK
jgi:hypothetical protein